MLNNFEAAASFYKDGDLGYDSIDVALIIRQNGQFFTYGSINHESWPPSIKEIVRLCRNDTIIYAKL
jgi:hypothetical protein